MVLPQEKVLGCQVEISPGEPLFLDVAATLQEDSRFAGVQLLGGRYGLGCKEQIFQ